MSEPAKNPGQQPESFQPQKPEMMRALEEAQGQTEAQGASQATSSSGGSGSIPGIHRLINSDGGENYWFNGCAAYVMEALGEPDYDYWFFAGLTGDNFAQVFARDHFRGNGVTDYRLSEAGGHRFIEDVFGTCGYASAFVTEKQFAADKGTYLRMLTGYIDRGIPVIRHRWPVSSNQWGWGVFVGYENGGETLLYITGDKTEPERIPLEEALFDAAPESQQSESGWIFVGEKKEQKNLRQIYRDAIINLPKLLTAKTDAYCFGSAAFRAWAAEVESGKFDSIKQKEFSSLAHNLYIVYVVNVATNSGGGWGFMDKAKELNPDFTFLEEVRRQYRTMGLLWWSKYKADDGFPEEYAKLHGGLPDNLEDLNAGIFHCKIKSLQNPKKRAKVVAVIRQCADCMDEVVRIIEQGVKET